MTNRSVRDILYGIMRIGSEMSFMRRLAKRGDAIIALTSEALEVLAADPVDPWHRRPGAGWTPETLPPDAAMVNFVFDGCVQIGYYAAHSEKFIGDKYGFPIDCVEAYMVIPEVVDPSAGASVDTVDA